MYVLMLSIHGLIRGHDLELGRDADTGGQTKYVLELARALGERDDVNQVDLVTRRIIDPSVSPDYAEPITQLTPKTRIVRIDAGPDGYLPKEQLWDYLDNFVDNLTAFLHEQGCWPTIVHSHYADAGFVGIKLSNLIGVSLVHTGHSLGRDKRQRLLAAGLDSDQIDTRYNMLRRIEAEETVLASAELIITSTHNEIEEQYGLYDYYLPERMQVIPPGVDLQQFYPPDESDILNPFADELARFLDAPEKPLVLALSRADQRKNLVTFLESYGECQPLRACANVLIIAGNRDDIRDLDENARTVLTDLLITIDAYDLYGQVAIPKHHSANDVPKIYRLVAHSKGVFINPALTEPFGLTLLEAAATGLPIVATENGGPVDIINNCHNGQLIDPFDRTAISQALLAILENPQLWQQYSDSGRIGVQRYYAWSAHAATYCRLIAPLVERHEIIPDTPPMRRSLAYRDRAFFTDLDEALIGDFESLNELITIIRRHKRCANFGVVTGRRRDSALTMLRQHHIPIPDVLITGLGTEIHYSTQLVPDDYWHDHIDHLWKPKAIRQVLATVPGLTLQNKTEQSRFKIAYLYTAEIAPSLEDIATLLRTHDLSVNLLCAFGHFLDVVPIRASKGQAVRYVAHRFGIALDHVLVVGNSAADEDMMRGNTLAVVLANHHANDLASLAELERIYFAQHSYARGILEAIDYYDFFRTCSVPAV
ncbi:HAD-IIB family hydrolase [Rhodoferax sp. 4810]|uniref:sucrose-phosphate synthase n=1 Tax=Thiospirillum jenense TaxID=1653858 RepID=A0A839H5H9_9GAMM|nr:HAD-IIB family hydrolase [Thiospirillum jenense]MBB1073840.1 HAD-IIB family hydrolase [Rhodoferax jenense]MBB1125205.1 HAD-IIB family hydrolase [Thiospirillum jenense]